METETKNPKEEDGQAVAAVRDGDAERYRELVERHERRVYAIAWSRLGDAALAEEATQEAFIRGYRGLKLLGNGRKFSGWIAAIARNVAINLGLRHRRELKKRERWALEQVDAEETASDESGEPFAPETLRQTLEELPAKHRECLVLFYLEGKDGAESAAVLGVTEAAFRVRLHRARGALRKHLEARLAGSLENLRPGRSLVPLVMSAILTSSTTKAMAAGGTGMTVLGTLVKLSPLKWLLPILPLLIMLPAAFLQSKLLRSEMRNFKDRDGIRSAIYNENLRTVKLGGMSIVLLILVPIALMNYLDVRNWQVYLAVLLLPVVIGGIRQLNINRSRYFIVVSISSSLVIGSFALMATGYLPHIAFHPTIVFQLICTALVFGERPVRMDYNLFIRATEGLLENKGEPEEATVDLSKKELIAMARFLGTRWIVDGYRWVKDGLILRLPPVQLSFLDRVLTYRWSNRSRLLLKWNGEVHACLSHDDKQSLVYFSGTGIVSDEELESCVAHAVASAWENVRRGQCAMAEKAIGQIPDSEVFKKPRSTTRAARVQLAIALCLLVMLGSFYGLRFFWPTSLSGMKVVPTTEQEVREFFEREMLKPPPPKPKGDPVVGAARYYFTLPSTNMLSAYALRSLRDKFVEEDQLFEEMKGGRERVGWTWSWSGREAIDSRWISFRDLDLDGRMMREFLVSSEMFSRDRWHLYFVPPYRATSQDGTRVFGSPYLRYDSVGRLASLDEFNCLDLIDRDYLIREISALQLLSKPRPEDPRVLHWRAFRGLFCAGSWEVLHQTFYCLAALEILDGLDQIDREACIKGILRRHYGKGFFDEPIGTHSNAPRINGDAQDTVAAFESLRILGALDRVDDLEEWEFRVRKGRGEDGELNWAIVSAWVAKQRLERFLREREENPDAPARSLLEP